MPRKKAVSLQEIVPAISATLNTEAPSPPAIIADTDENMVKRYLALKTWLEGEKKRFDAYVEPHLNEMDSIEGEFLKRFNERGQDASPTEHGTAYKQTILNVKISPEGPVYDLDGRDALTGRDAFIEACLDHWGEWGSDMLVLGTPQKDAVKKYLEDNEGKEPPGVKTSRFVKVNIRRS